MNGYACTSNDIGVLEEAEVQEPQCYPYFVSYYCALIKLYSPHIEWTSKCVDYVVAVAIVPGF